VFVYKREVKKVAFQTFVHYLIFSIRLRMMDSTEAKLEAMMDTKMHGLKGDIMEGLKIFLIERPPESDNVSHEIHDEDTRKINDV
jgi:hypothetical protein